MSFLTPEQQDLAASIGAMLSERGETVAVAEATAGGLISAALLSVAGASRYYAGGAVETDPAAPAPTEPPRTPA